MITTLAFPTLPLQLKNGKADIRLTMSDLLGLRNDWTSWENLVSRTIQVNAEVEETITGIVLVGNATVDCKRHRHTLKFLSMSPSNYKPGLLYTGFVSWVFQFGYTVWFCKLGFSGWFSKLCFELFEVGV